MEVVNAGVTSSYIKQKHGGSRGERTRRGLGGHPSPPVKGPVGLWQGRERETGPG